MSSFFTLCAIITSTITFSGYGGSLGLHQG